MCRICGCRFTRSIVVLDAGGGSRSDAPTVEVTEYATWQLDVKWLEGWLAQAPQGKAFEARNSSFIVDLPMPDGSLERFTVVNSPIMAPSLPSGSLKSGLRRAGCRSP